MIQSFICNYNISKKKVVIWVESLMLTWLQKPNPRFLNDLADMIDLFAFLLIVNYVDFSIYKNQSRDEKWACNKLKSCPCPLIATIQNYYFYCTSRSCLHVIKINYLLMKMWSSVMFIQMTGNPLALLICISQIA